jgi:hypothetical protein
LSAEGYTFHQPCPPPAGDTEAKELDGVEAKPRGAKEPRLKDALHTIALYLDGKPNVAVYKWPAREKDGDLDVELKEDNWDEDDWDGEDDLA